MKRENFRISSDGLEYCDYSFLCMTGGMEPYGLNYQLAGGLDCTDEIIIGCIDSPEKLPAGGFEFLDNPIMHGMFAKIVQRD